MILTLEKQQELISKYNEKGKTTDELLAFIDGMNEIIKEINKNNK